MVSCHISDILNEFEGRVVQQVPNLVSQQRFSLQKSFSLLLMECTVLSDSFVVDLAIILLGSIASAAYKHRISSESVILTITMLNELIAGRSIDPAGADSLQTHAWSVLQSSANFAVTRACLNFVDMRVLQFTSIKTLKSHVNKLLVLGRTSMSVASKCRIPPILKSLCGSISRCPEVFTHDCIEELVHFNATISKRLVRSGEKGDLIGESSAAAWRCITESFPQFIFPARG